MPRVELRSKGIKIWEGDCPSTAYSYALCLLTPDNQVIFGNSLAGLWNNLAQLVLGREIQDATLLECRYFVYDGETRRGEEGIVYSYWEVEIFWGPFVGKEARPLPEEKPLRRVIEKDALREETVEELEIKAAKLAGKLLLLNMELHYRTLFSLRS